MAATVEELVDHREFEYPCEGGCLHNALAWNLLDDAGKKSRERVYEKRYLKWRTKFGAPLFATSPVAKLEEYRCPMSRLSMFTGNGDYLYYNPDMLYVPGQRPGSDENREDGCLDVGSEDDDGGYCPFSVKEYLTYVLDYQRKRQVEVYKNLEAYGENSTYVHDLDQSIDRMTVDLGAVEMGWKSPVDVLYDKGDGWENEYAGALTVIARAEVYEGSRQYVRGRRREREMNGWVRVIIPRPTGGVPWYVWRKAPVPMPVPVVVEPEPEPEPEAEDEETERDRAAKMARKREQQRARKARQAAEDDAYAQRQGSLLSFGGGATVQKSKGETTEEREVRQTMRGEVNKGKRLAKRQAGEETDSEFETAGRRQARPAVETAVYAADHATLVVFGTGRSVINKDFPNETPEQRRIRLEKRANMRRLKAAAAAAAKTGDESVEYGFPVSVLNEE